MPAKMTPDHLRKAGVKLYGKRAWQTRLSEELGVDGSTVRRWVSGAVPIPQPVAAAIRCFLSVDNQKSKA
jgi:hypothetical protein